MYRSAVSSILVGLLGVACGETPGPEPLPPIEDLPWPTSDTEQENCTPFDGGFSMPALSAASGAILAFPSSPLLPIGQPNIVEVLILDAPDGDVDASASGNLLITVDGGAPLAAAATEGRAEFELVLDDVGNVGVTFEFQPDGREGTVELYGYETQLPVWDLSVDAAELAELLATPESRLEIEVALAIDGANYEATLRLHGGSSRFFPKKSFRLDLKNGLTEAGERHLILRSEYNDKTMLRNWLGLDLFRNATWLPTPRSELVHLRINNRFYGVLNHVERIDSDFLLRNGLSPSASLYEADPPHELSSPGGNLTPLEPDLYPVVYQWHNGGEDYVDLIDLIEGTLLQQESTFARSASEDIAIDDLIVYLAAMAVIQNHDHVRKNYYLYRDVYGKEDRWFALPWDLELTFGHLWSEENDVFDERVVSDGDLFVGMQIPSQFGYYNQMTERLLSIPEYRERYLAMLDRISATALRPERLAERLENVVCRATPDLLADTRKRATNDEFEERVGEILDYAVGRREHIEAALQP